MTKREAGLLAVTSGALLGWKTVLSGYNAMERSRDDKWFENEQMRKEGELVSYQVNECLKQRDKLRAEVERLRAATVDDPACSDPMCSYRAEALTRGAMPTLTPEQTFEAVLRVLETGGTVDAMTDAEKAGMIVAALERAKTP